MTTRNPTRRKGMAIITVLVVMAVLTVLLSVVTLQLVVQRQTIRQRQRQMQAEWLARAGVERAAARLLHDPSAFTEENLTLLPDAKVHIVVEKSGQAYTVTAEAEVGQIEEMPVVRTVVARFLRTDNDGVRLQAIPVEKKKAP